MGLFEVDMEKCRMCGACVDECPTRVVEMKTPDSLPTPVDGAEEHCINCGHCVAVCPRGAFALETMAPEQCPPVRAAWLLDPERAEHFLRARRSIRAFKPRPVEREVLAKLIDVARCAPTGSNRQNVRWLVIQDRDDVQRYASMVVDWMRHLAAEETRLGRTARESRIIRYWDAGVDYICRDAPHVVVAFGPSDGGATNCAIALSYLELAAPSFSLGACWAGFFNRAANQWPPLQQALGIPEGHAPFGAMMVGYPRHAYHRLPLRDEPRIDWR